MISCRRWAILVLLSSLLPINGAYTQDEDIKISKEDRDRRKADEARELTARKDALERQIENASEQYRNAEAAFETAKSTLSDYESNVYQARSAHAAAANAYQMCQASQPYGSGYYPCSVYFQNEQSSRAYLNTAINEYNYQLNVYNNSVSRMNSASSRVEKLQNDLNRL